MISTLFRHLFPLECLSCRNRLPPAHSQLICESCWHSINTLENYCLHCTLPLVTEFLCSHCRQEHNSPFDQIFIGFDYQSKAITDLIRTLKFERKPYVAAICAQLLFHHFAEILKKKFADYHIVPIPSDRIHFAYRGFNPTYKIALELSRLLALPLHNDLLHKRAFYQPQRLLSREERLTNLHGAFQLNPKAQLPAKILLVDDVYTTGQTILSAAQTLRKSGINSLSILVFSKA